MRDEVGRSVPTISRWFSRHKQERRAVVKRPGRWGEIPPYRTGPTADLDKSRRYKQLTYVRHDHTILQALHRYHPQDLQARAYDQLTSRTAMTRSLALPRAAIYCGGMCSMQKYEPIPIQSILFMYAYLSVYISSIIVEPVYDHLILVLPST